VTYQPNFYRILVPAQGFEPWTIGLKVPPDLRKAPRHGTLPIRMTARSVLVAPIVALAWLYGLAIRSAGPPHESRIHPATADPPSA
jgi:hypothetical protein